LGAVALVFLIIALYNRVKAKAAPAGAPTNGEEPSTAKAYEGTTPGWSGWGDIPGLY